MGPGRVCNALADLAADVRAGGAIPDGTRKLN